MGVQGEDPREFLPLTPAVLEILLALAEEDLHGYAIMPPYTHPKYCIAAKECFRYDAGWSYDSVW
jgi:hypothetical protein